ncbi:MAG TPA: nuclease-related domain-containing protein [Bacilli bacterium]
MGEKKVAHQLKFLGPEYKVLNGKTIRARANHQEFDHVVIGPNGVFHIETKYWSGRVAFTEQGVEREGEKAAADPTAQLYRHEYILKELLKEIGVRADVVGVLCFAHPKAQIEGKSPAFITAKVDRLLHVIKSHKPKRPLSPKEVQHIFKHISAQ